MNAPVLAQNVNIYQKHMRLTDVTNKEAVERRMQL